MLSRESILEYLSKEAKPVFETKLFSDMEIAEDTAPLFYELIAGLEKVGDIIRTKKNKYALPDKMGLVLGELRTSPKGFGFVRPKDGAREIFIPANEMGTAMNGDLVYAKIIENARGDFKAEGSIVKVVKRANSKVVGTFKKGKNYGFIIPDDAKLIRDIFISKNDSLDALDGQKVVCEITNWSDARSLPSGRVIEILGNLNDKGVDILSVIRKYDLPEEFDDVVKAEAEAITQEVRASDIEGRKDYRDYSVVTIDGVDAKDIDDAVWAEKNEDGSFLLMVHIADVAHYVKKNTAIDREALKRGNSVYLIDRVIPMLPKSLSNGICSLNEAVDRLTFSVEMKIDREGHVTAHEIHEGVIRSKKRLNYAEVTELMERGGLDPASHMPEDVQNMLFVMRELAELLNQKRQEKGVLNFDFPEPYIVLNEDGKPVSVEERERGISDKIIEEFMLITNEVVAEHMYWLDVPFVYRIHEHPDVERLESLNQYISTLGFRLRMKQKEVEPKEIRALLDKLKDLPEEGIISKMILRALKQARYSPHCDGHFGLASKFYCHFTAPIRRYADLEIHRIMKNYFLKGLSQADIQRLEIEVEEVSHQVSTTERVAESAEREVDDMKRCEFMEDKVGEEFEGLISGINRFGLYTELANTITGFTKVSNLENDYYNFDEISLAFVGARTGYTYRIGDRVRVRVDRVDVDLREIDFAIIEHTMRKRTTKSPDKVKFKGAKKKSGAKSQAKALIGKKTGKKVKRKKGEQE